MYELPTAIIANDGTSYKIRNNGDYRMVFDFLEALDDMNLKPLERLYAGLIFFYEDFYDIEDVDNLPKGVPQELLSKALLFINLNEEPSEQDKKKPKLVDWKADSTLVVAAINNVIGKEIRLEEYVHWWTFISYYMSIGDCALATVINIRDKIAHQKKLEKYEKEFRANNMKYFTVDLRTHQQKLDDEWLKSVWNS